MATDEIAQGGGGGGGPGAGGDVFVQQGRVLLIEGGSLAAGTVQGGAAGATGGVAGHAGGTGDLFGNGMFIQGNQAVTLDPTLGQVLTIAGVISDQTGSGGTGTNDGAGALVVGGPGSVVLSADNTFTGGITLTAGARLELAATEAGGGAGLRSIPARSCRSRPGSRWATPSRGSCTSPPSTSAACPTSAAPAP
jgi:autotransporter-associated beta strand protein